MLYCIIVTIFSHLVIFNKDDNSDCSDFFF